MKTNLSRFERVTEKFMTQKWKTFRSQRFISLSSSSIGIASRRVSNQGESSRPDRSTYLIDIDATRACKKLSPIENSRMRWKSRHKRSGKTLKTNRVQWHVDLTLISWGYLNRRGIHKEMRVICMVISHDNDRNDSAAAVTATATALWLSKSDDEDNDINDNNDCGSLMI